MAWIARLAILAVTASTAQAAVYVNWNADDSTSLLQVSSSPRRADGADADTADVDGAGGGTDAENTLDARAGHLKLKELDSRLKGQTVEQVEAKLMNQLESIRTEAKMKAKSGYPPDVNCVDDCQEQRPYSQALFDTYVRDMMTMWSNYKHQMMVASGREQQLLATQASYDAQLGDTANEETNMYKSKALGYLGSWVAAGFDPSVLRAAFGTWRQDLETQWNDQKQTESINAANAQQTRLDALAAAGRA
jgi:hypothetical protein